MRHINLEQFADGALSAQVNKALQKVTENIIDPNTDPTKARKITVTITMKANPERNFSAAAVETKVALAPELGTVAAFSMGKDLKTGEVDCVEIGNQIPGQLSFKDVEAQNIDTEEPVRGYDPSTGEIYETEPSNNVVDLRTARQEETLNGK